MMSESLQKKIDASIKLINSAYSIASQNKQDFIEVAYSGGKDSDVILELAKMSGVPYKAIYKCTTIDPPGTIKYVKSKGVEVRMPKLTFFQLVEKHGLPNRFMRFCCGYLKEYFINRYVIIGVRRSESTKRSKIKEPEICRSYQKRKVVHQFLPILEWSNDDVEEFIKERGIQCHPLYYDEFGKNIDDKATANDIVFNFQATAIGVEAGSSHVRAFTELGIGEQGIALAGVRFKF